MEADCQEAEDELNCGKYSLIVFLIKKKISSSSELLSNNSLFGGQL